jgi:ATP-dependent exoDNAse (exonuclease V) beta subunit
VRDARQYLKLDEDARQRALEIDSFIVQAPAGAGKTELLTQRFLRLLATVEAPEEIVAITFTNKAAAEMRARILSSLEMAVREENPPEPHKRVTLALAKAVLAADAARQWGLMQHPGRLQVSTIDALCARLARQMPFLSRFGTQPMVRDDCTPHYEEAARATLELLEGGDEVAETVARALDYFDNDNGRLLKLLVAMLGKRDQWLHRVAAAGSASIGTEAGLRHLVGLELAEVGRYLDPVRQAGIMAAARYAAAQAAASQSDSPIAALVDWAEPLLGEANEFEAWRGLAVLLLTTDGVLRKRLDPKLGLSTPEGKPHGAALKQCLESLGAEAEAALARLLILPETRLDDSARQVIADFSNLLRLANAQLWLVFQSHGEVDFIGVAERARMALGSDDDPTELRERLDARISHLLVDEFQDTSPNQVRLLERLTSDWQAGDGRTLFLVGDPMQSIYRFRKADVGLFLEAKARGIGSVPVTPLQLYRNNRSDAQLVGWVNAVFPGIFAATDNVRRGQIAFAPAFNQVRRPGALVRVHPVIDAEGLGDPAELREARQVIELIRSARAGLAPGESVAVLVRARTHLEALVAEIRRQAPDIRYRAVEIEGLAERQVVQDLAALVRALHHRADRVNWLAILRAPWCGLTLPDLHALAADDHASTIWQLMHDENRLASLGEDGRARLLHLRQCVAEALVHQGRVRPRRWVEGVWQMLGGPFCLQGEADGLDAQAFFRLLDKLESNGRLELERLDEELARFYAAPDPGAPETVQFMTIHKSKGLEFDTVILPGLHRSVSGQDTSLLAWDEFVLEDGREHLVAAPVNKGKRDKNAAPSAYDYLRELEKERGENESRRLLYVAVTRAKRRLHLAGVAKQADGGLRAPSSATLLALLWPQVAAEFEEAATRETDAAAPPADQPPFVPRLVRLAQLAMPDCLLAVETTGTVIATPEPAGTAAVSDLETDVGTLIHRYLELVAKQGLSAWPVSRIDSLEPAFRHWFARRGHVRADAAEAAATVRQYLADCLNSETGRWVLGSHAEAQAEMPLTRLGDTGPQANVIDRTFVAEDTRWIIDYKTTRAAVGACEEALKRQAESYRSQLERYAALFEGDGLPVRMAVFFVASQSLVTLQAQAAA